MQSIMITLLGIWTLISVIWALSIIGDKDRDYRWWEIPLFLPSFIIAAFIGLGPFHYIACGGCGKRVRLWEDGRVSVHHAQTIGRCEDYCPASTQGVLLRANWEPVDEPQCLKWKDPVNDEVVHWAIAAQRNEARAG